MGYLFIKDYKKLIQTDNLNQIIGSDNSLLTDIESVAQSELISYLSTKYDTDKEFTNTKKYEYNVTRNAKDRVYLDATAYSTSSTYALNALTLYQGSVYRCSTAVTSGEAFNAAKWTLLGAQYDLFYITLPKDEWDYYTTYETGAQVWYKNKTYTATRDTTSETPDTNSAVWGTGTTYTVAGTVWPTDTTKWSSGDNRNTQLVMYMVDIALYHIHSRISPNNIPELRFTRYSDAKVWLDNVAKEEKIVADIPKVQPAAGSRILWGSSLSKQNNNF